MLGALRGAILYVEVDYWECEEHSILLARCEPTFSFPFFPLIPRLKYFLIRFPSTLEPLRDSSNGLPTYKARPRNLPLSRSDVSLTKHDKATLRFLISDFFSDFQISL